jgi:hypothetical protein
VMPRIRSLVWGMRKRTFTPVVARVDIRSDALESRLDAIDASIAGLLRRLEEIEVVMQTTGARAAALTERSLGNTESSLRIERRMEDIERLLGAPAADR